MHCFLTRQLSSPSIAALSSVRLTEPIPQPLGGREASLSLACLSPRWGGSSSPSDHPTQVAAVHTFLCPLLHFSFCLFASGQILCLPPPPLLFQLFFPFFSSLLSCCKGLGDLTGEKENWTRVQLHHAKAGSQSDGRLKNDSLVDGGRGTAREGGREVGRGGGLLLAWAGERGRGSCLKCAKLEWHRRFAEMDSLLPTHGSTVAQLR